MIDSFIQSQQEWAADLLCRLIAFESTAGNEQGVQEFLFGELQSLGFAPERVPIEEDITSDPDYTQVEGHKGYSGRCNITFHLVGGFSEPDRGRSLILNSHSDVVPGPREAFHPRREGDIVFGRGACDAKGQVVTLILAMRALREGTLRPEPVEWSKGAAPLAGTVEGQIVIEEEVGGNGSLSLIRRGHRADAAIVLEPGGLGVYPANRGAVWFRLAVKGRPVHMAKYYEGVSALDEMLGLIEILKDYERRLILESRGHPLFPDDPSPVKVNIGQIAGGDWPSMVPGECVIEGGIGFLPNKRLSDITEEVRQAVESGASEWAKANYTLEFARIHNDAYETPVDHPAVQALARAADSVRGPQMVRGFIASCDARLFHHRGRMPTIVFGPGDLAYAHADDEQISISEILDAARILARFAMGWCGG